MTAQQRGVAMRAAVLATIRASVKTHGYPPTVREIADAVGLASTSAVVYHLRVLAAQGAIRRVAGSPRALVIADIYPDTSEAASAGTETASDPTKEIHS